jgi:predicted metal-dependent phosphoesterase TrpH/thiamine kinase-like enzyme
MLIEMHCHTAEHSACSSVSAVDLVRQVFGKGLQAIVLTDHHYLWPVHELEALREAAAVPDHFRIMSGQEVRTELGDVLVYGATGSLQTGTSLADIRRLYPGSALVLAHPYRRNRVPSIADLMNPFIDGVEIFNTNHTVLGNSRGLQDWHRHHFTATAGTDTHGSGYAGVYPTIFDHPMADVQELASEIRHGRCRPFLKEIPRSGAHALVTEVTIGTKGRDEQRERIIIRSIDSDIRWSSAERAFQIMQALAANGFDAGRYRVPRPIDEDRASRTFIEQGIRGKSLFDKLVSSPPETRQEYFELAARWVARFHRLRLCLTPEEEFLAQEEKRIGRYLQRFENIDHPHTGKVRDMAARLLAEERGMAAGSPALLIQGHGDYHPKNIIIGQDSLEDRATMFVAAIDFASSLALPPAFDVGCFLAQFRNQLFPYPEILSSLPDYIFLQAYVDEAGGVDEEFHRQVEIFRARTNLSIAAYLIKVGMGDSPDLWRVIVEAEQFLTV